MLETTVRYYLGDTLRELMARARDAKAKAKAAAQVRTDANAVDASEVAFERGRAMAYYEVVSHMIGQLEGFGIDRATVGLDPSYDVDRDLL